MTAGQGLAAAVVVLAVLMAVSVLVPFNQISVGLLIAFVALLKFIP